MIRIKLNSIFASTGLACSSKRTWRKTPLCTSTV